MINIEHIKKLQDIIRRKSGEDLPLPEVEAIARRLIDYYSTLARIASRLQRSERPEIDIIAKYDSSKMKILNNHHEEGDPLRKGIHQRTS